MQLFIFVNENVESVNCSAARKLKNRVAAQTARDRKKALMVELEDKVAILEDENRLLKEQNVSLKQASSLLAKENASLKSQLACKSLFLSKTDSTTKGYVPFHYSQPRCVIVIVTKNRHFDSVFVHIVITVNINISIAQ